MFVNKDVLILSSINRNNPFNIKDTTKILPELIEKLIVELILKECNISITREEPLEELLHLIPEAKLKTIIDTINNKMYRCQGKTDYSTLYHSYLLYYLPNNIFKIWTPLLDLACGLKLNRNISVMDIGSGPGSLSIGLILFYKYIAVLQQDKDFSLVIKCVDSENIFLKYSSFIMKALIATLPRNLKVQISYSETNINSYADLKDINKYDLITIGNFLNSFEHNKGFDIHDLIAKLRNNLKSSGSLIIIEPGDRAECLRLKDLRNKISKEKLYNIYSPCNCIWESREGFNCSCFTSYSLFQQKIVILDKLHSLGLNKQKHKSHIAFNYLIMRLEKGQKYLINYNKLNYTPLSNIFDFEGDKINVKGIVRFNSKEKYLFSICDGTINSKLSPVIIQLPKDNPQYSDPIIKNLNMGEMVSIRGARLSSISSNQVKIIAEESTKIKIEY